MAIKEILSAQLVRKLRRQLRDELSALLEERIVLIKDQLKAELTEELQDYIASALLEDEPTPPTT